MDSGHVDGSISDLGLSDMDSGHVDGSISGPDAGCNLKNIYKTCINNSKKNPIYIYIYIYQSGGGSPNGIFYPCARWDWGWPRFEFLPPAPPGQIFQGRKSQEISSLDGTRHGVLVCQSLCKMSPRRLKMKKRFFVISGGRKLCDVLKSKNQEEKQFLVRTVF